MANNHPDEPVLHEHKEFRNIDYSEKTLRGSEFFQCTFINCNFHKSDLGRNEFSHCRFEGCNFTMAVIADTGFADVTFNNCKLLGLDFTTCNKFMFSFAFSHCQMDFSVFLGAKLKKTRFNHCSLKEAVFTEADLTQAVFATCDLQGAQFAGTNLEKADLRTAYNFHIDPEHNKMKKAQFSHRNLAGLLNKYNLDIEYDG